MVSGLCKFDLVASFIEDWLIVFISFMAANYLIGSYSKCVFWLISYQVAKMMLAILKIFYRGQRPYLIDKDLKDVTGFCDQGFATPDSKIFFIVFVAFLGFLSYYYEIG